jgi:hypothetical protein
MGATEYRFNNDGSVSTGAATVHEDGTITRGGDEGASTGIKVSPFGMEECCVCDAPTTHVVDDVDGCWYPHCAGCARAVREAFPSVRVLLWGVKS